jgi:hypothetical protein
MAIRAGCPIAFASIANSFCSIVKPAVFVIPITLYFNIAILRYNYLQIQKKEL